MPDNIDHYAYYIALQYMRPHPSMMDSVNRTFENCLATLQADVDAAIGALKDFKISLDAKQKVWALCTDRR